MKQNPTSREAAKYWVIAPMESKPEISKLFEAAWEYDRQHGTIAIGWCCDSLTLQDISQFTNADEFQAEIRKHQPKWKSVVVQKTIWDFHCEMQVGDTVIARRGLNEILGIGIVKKTAYYDFAKGKNRISISSPIPEKHQEYIKPRFVEVFWVIIGNFSVQLEQLELKRNKIFQEITDSQYQKLQLMLKEAFKDIPDLNAHETIEIAVEETHQEQQPERKWIWAQRPRSSSSEPNYYIGIDLGTTNSVMAWGSINPRTNQLEPNIVPINMMTAYYAMQKKPLLPSSVYFEEGRSPNVGEYAKKMLEVQPDRVFESIKHEIGTQKEFEIDGTFYTPSQILALIIRHLAASAKSHFGFIPDNAVITVPAYFNTKMRTATIEAAKLTGFRTTDDNGNPRAILLDEPYAVLYDRINQEIRGEVEAFLSKPERSKIVLIFDLGGGALEVSLHQVSYQKNQDRLYIKPIARSYNQIGGNKFDESLANHFSNIFYKKFKPYLDNFQGSQLNNAFRQYAEQAKIDLSKKIAFEKKIENWDPNKTLDKFIIPPIIQKPVWDKKFEYEGFSLEEYERIIAPFLASHLILENFNKSETKDLANDNIIYPIFDVLRKFKDRMDKCDKTQSKQLKENWPKFPHVDIVLLNGGMTKLHTIQKRLETFFGSTPLLTSSDGAVARGAVVFHYNSEQREFKSPPRITQEPILIIIAAQKTGGALEGYNIYAGAHLPITRLKPFDLPLPIGATSAKLTVYIISPNISALDEIKKELREKKELHGFRYRKKELHEFQFGRPLKEKDLPLSVLMSINEQGELNVEAHPKDNPDERFTVTVNLEALWQERFTQHKTGGLRYLNTDSEIAELTANFRQLQRTNNLDIRRQILNRIETQGSRILQSPNVEKFVTLLCKKVNSLDNLGKMLMMNLLGNLAATCSDADPLHKICDVAIKLVSSREINTKDQTYVDSVVKTSIVTIGKTGLSTAKSSLFDLLDMDETSTIRSTIIHSIGKIGSREKKEPLPIQQLSPIISNFIEQLGTNSHDKIKRNSIYALAEICDRRKCASDIVSPGTAAEVILLLVTFLNYHVRDKLSDLPPSELHDKLQETTLLAIQMIRGIDLSPNEKERLRAIRKEN